MHRRFRQAMSGVHSESLSHIAPICLSTVDTIGIVAFQDPGIQPGIIVGSDPFPLRRGTCATERKEKDRRKEKKGDPLVILPGTQATVASPAKFGRHSQIIVLIGNVSTTLHLALTMHGLVSAQGSLQTPPKHASLLGQSASTWHPASGSSGSKG